MKLLNKILKRFTHCYMFGKNNKVVFIKNGKEIKKFFMPRGLNINIKGISSHLGTAKNAMVNSQLIANELINLIPKEYPQTTEGYDGYYHLDSIVGNITETKIKFLIRDFEKENFEQRKQKFIKIVEALNKKYNNCINISISDSYYNMKEVITKHMHLIENAKLAMQSVNVEPLIHEVRGGTDGSDLSEKGLPCPNLGTGGHNFHGIYEYICLEDMKKVTEILVELVKIYAKFDLTKIKKY